MFHNRKRFLELGGKEEIKKQQVGKKSCALFLFLFGFFFCVRQNNTKQNNKDGHRHICSKSFQQEGQARFLGDLLILLSKCQDHVKEEERTFLLVVIT